MWNKVLTVSVVVLVLFSVFNLAQSNTTAQQTRDLADKVAAIPTQTVVYKGEKGDKPKEGIDYFIRAPKDGTNAVSFVTTQTVIKEVPLIGPSAYDIWLQQGNSGSKDDFLESLRASLDIRVNPDTNDIETRSSGQRFYNLLVACQDYRLVCPDAN